MAVRLSSLALVAVAALPFGTAVALADDGPSRLLSATGRLHPAETVERVVNTGSGRALVTVLGYGATPEDDGYFDRLAADMPDRTRLDFGLNGAGRYDTRGPLRESASGLAREVRRRVREDDLDDVVVAGVSQGGVVAVGSGLSRNDNVSGIVTIASPLNGTTTARLLLGTDRIVTAFGAHGQLEAIFAPLGAGLDDPALRDLARAEEWRVAPGVSFYQNHSVQDPLVFGWDADVPGRTLETLTPGVLTAHGGQLSEAGRRRAIVAELEGREVTTGPLERAVALLVRPAIDGLHLTLFVGIAIIAIVAAVGLRAAGVAPDRIRDAVTRVAGATLRVWVH